VIGFERALCVSYYRVAFHFKPTHTRSSFLGFQVLGDLYSEIQTGEDEVRRRRIQKLWFLRG
jgi:hypothetical protein